MKKNTDEHCLNFERNLRKRAEQLLTLGTCMPMNNLEIEGIVHELNVYKIELELQNREIRNSYKQLQEAHLHLIKTNKQLVSLYNYAPVAFVTIDQHGKICHSNHTASLLFDTAKKLVDTQIIDYVYEQDEDTFYFYKNALAHGQMPSPCEFRLRDGVTWVKCDGFQTDFSTEKLNFVFTDITVMKGTGK